MLYSLVVTLGLALSPLACGDKDDDTGGSSSTDGGSAGDGGGASDGGSAGDGGSEGDGGAFSETAYSECSASRCGEAEDCLTLLGEDYSVLGAPFCSPECSEDSDCPSFEGYPGKCTLYNGYPDPSNCSLPCSLDDLACPTGMECMDYGEADGTCMWPI